jgi:hypothetical protein
MTDQPRRNTTTVTVHSNTYGHKTSTGMTAHAAGARLRSLLDAMTRSQSRTLCFFKNFFVRYLRYLPQGV